MKGGDGNTMKTTASESKRKDTYSQNNCLKGYRAASERQDCEWMAVSIIHQKVLCNCDASKEKLQSVFTNKFTCLSPSRERGADKLFYPCLN